MRKYLQIKIDQPCHEDWDKMTASEKGRFCNSCQKQVIDFTNMSDGQLAEFLKKRRGATDGCGRFKDDQLDRSIQMPVKKIPWAQYIIPLTVPFVLGSLRTSAQDFKLEKVELSADRICVIRPTIKIEALNKIRGRIVDSFGTPIPFASVIVLKTNTGSAADSSGYFELDIRKKGVLSLEISAVGFESMQVATKANEDMGTIILKNIPDLDPIISTAYTGFRLGGYRTGSMSVIEKENSVLQMKNDNDAAIRIFPNPANAGSTTTIQIAEPNNGKRMVELVNSFGQQIFSQQLNLLKGTTNYSLTIPSAVSKGVYFARVTLGNNKKSISTKLLIE